jgi:pyruvate dehydrogenase complex dehydrogenase (E1) component
MVGIRDRFGESGSLLDLMKLHEVTAPHIVAAAKRVMARKNMNHMKEVSIIDNRHSK